MRWIVERLKEKDDLIKGFRSLRNLQVLGQSALTAENVIMQIPQELQTFTELIIAQSKADTLLSFDEIKSRVAALALQTKNDGVKSIATNQSVPFDLLAFDNDDNLLIFCLTHLNATEPEMKELRRRLIFLRYFSHHAFGERPVDKIQISAAFYAD